MIAAALSSTTVIDRKQSHSKTVAMSACAASRPISVKLAHPASDAGITLPQSIKSDGDPPAEPSRQGSLPKSSSAALASRAAK